MRSAFGKPVNTVSSWYRLATCLLALTSVSTTAVAQSVRIDSVVTINAYGLPKSYQSRDTLSLPAQENYLTFYCSADKPTPILYRLSGLDATWRSGYSNDQFHFANLIGNTYVFQVREAKNRNTLAINQLTISLNAPFWKRIWFWPMVFLYVIGLISVIVYLFVRYRFLQKLRALKVRDRIARDLHDDMGSYLSSISILSAAMPTDPIRARQNLDRIGQTARQVMDSMSDIVWSINPTQDTMQQVLDRMKQVADDLLGTTETTVQFEIGPGVETLSLPLERRRDFFLIYKEALTNTARYAEASSVLVKLEQRSGQLILCLSDNGRGFDTHNPTARTGGGNGLRNLHTRATLLSGTLSVCSSPGQGTQVKLSFPV
ncbi:sensor histidine kinase [Fibrella aquatica]|jgi:signal transduction histidine kinase|uniref:sensor histidine kinase n=1 Tax=Fibrella aquatica TaxID=3242487 RepID=UPI003521DD0E